MAQPPDQPEDPHDDSPEDDVPEEENIEIVLGPKDNPDGTPIDPDEERRRQESIRYDAERIAEECGLKIRDIGHVDYRPQVPTPRAEEIVEKARPELEKASAGFEASYDRTTKRYPDGTIETSTRMRFRAIAEMRNVFKGMREVINEALKRTPRARLGLAIKIGKLVTFKGSGSATIGDEEDPPVVEIPDSPTDMPHAPGVGESKS